MSEHRSEAKERSSRDTVPGEAGQPPKAATHTVPGEAGRPPKAATR